MEGNRKGGLKGCFYSVQIYNTAKGGRTGNESSRE